MSDAVVKQRASVYTVMLIVAFLCMVVACLMLYFEMNRFEFKTKVPAELRAKDAETMAQNAANPAPAEPDPMDAAAPMDPAAPMPMDPAAPMPMDPAAPMPAPVDPAAPMAPAMPAEPAAM